MNKFIPFLPIAVRADRVSGRTRRPMTIRRDSQRIMLVIALSVNSTEMNQFRFSSINALIFRTYRVVSTHSINTIPCQLKMIT